MNNYPNHNSLYNEIKEKADIVDIIGQYVNLEKKGANYIGLCPFHDDKSPSFYVSPSKKIFKCFSCNAAGNVISFVSKFKHISINEALREVGKTVGIKVAETEAEKLAQANSIYYDIMSDAATFYNFFLNNTKETENARKYLESRGITKDIIERFKIGVSGNNNESYKLLLLKNRLPLDMITTGIVRSNGTNYYDVFRNRIMFPLEDLNGNICGFSGRRYLDNDKESKYLNTGETIIFKKGQILYNFHKSIEDIKKADCVYLFEGFMDVIAAVKSGVKNSVASMGTALTKNQINAVSRLTKNIVVVYDSDEPGIMATIRAIDMLLEFGFNISAVSIPDGKDPDEYLQKNGTAALNDYLLNHKVSAMEYIYTKTYEKAELIDLNSKEEFKKDIFNNLIKFKSNSLAEVFLKRLSNDISISINSLKEDYQQFSNSFIQQTAQNVYFEEIPTSSSKCKTIIMGGKYKKSERKIILFSHQSKNNFQEVFPQIEYCSMDILERELLYKIRDYYDKHEIIDDNELRNMLNDEEKELLQEILNDKYIPDALELKIHIQTVKDMATAKILTMEVAKQNKSLADLSSISKKVKGRGKLRSSKGSK